ncbi:MAG: hypothetical protein DU429_04000 [Candidatus Tokpelaia sp.]|nr:MAG: hypothetical protein DU430_06375 [Candidatus Tokpelaia sp.]KAA6207021.1 MAG: hypothetical protein DU429_04000 [Candidatus Tokpelaia sp.]KAA6405440.1 hypothetical protein DPQ22_05145 [Candidatus Tokpelaia sp.]
MPLSGCDPARFAGQLYFAAALIRACYQQIFASPVFRAAALLSCFRLALRLFCNQRCCALLLYYPQILFLPGGGYGDYTYPQ